VNTTPRIKLLDSHSTLQEMQSFDSAYFLKENNISECSLNGISPFSYFKVHYHTCPYLARYDFSIYSNRLRRLAALGVYKSRRISILFDQIDKQHCAFGPYYHPPSSAFLASLGIKAKEADLFISPETITNLLVEFMVEGSGILGKSGLIKLIPTLFQNESGTRSDRWVDSVTNTLQALHHEKKRARLIEVNLPTHFAIPPELEETQVRVLKDCFDSDYYAQCYQDSIPKDWLRADGAEKEHDDLFDYFISEGRLIEHSPCEFFDYRYYIKTYWKSIPDGEDAYYYYLTKGWQFRHNPSKRFTHEYLVHLSKSLSLESEHGPIGKILGSKYSACIILEQMQVCLTSNNDICYNSSTLHPRGKTKVESLVRAAPSVHAFYLTQYHPVSENDSNWGKGFTEWANVTKALPYFLGHNQPKLPLEGFYDLRIKENLHYQTRLAEEYGIDSFCFYFYWFQGKRVLERPLDAYLSNIDKTRSFTLLWANENWTRNWDGLEDDIILSQKYDESSCNSFCLDIAQYITHSCYYRVDGKPVFYIYRPSSIPNAAAWIEQVREFFRSNHGIELVIGIVQYLPNDKNPDLYGADLILQFPPNGFAGMAITTPRPKILRPASGNHLILDYQSMVDENLSLEYTGQVVRTCFPTWDNSPRKKDAWAAFAEADPSKFQTWLTNNLSTASSDNILGLTMINAWNEWAEGACIEPDRQHGYHFLHAVRDSRLHYSLNELQQGWIAKHKKAIVAHIYYDSAIEDVIKRAALYKGVCDIYITTHPKGLSSRVAKIFAFLPEARIFVTENRGRDVRPFLQINNLFNDLCLSYEYICKIHGKISTHRQDGIEWFCDVIDKLLPAPGDHQESLLKFLDDEGSESFGCLVPSGHVISCEEYLGGNQNWIQNLQRYISNSKPCRPVNLFGAGTMFWLGRPLLQNLVNHFIIDMFEPESGQLDETLAHGLERVFLWHAEYLGLNSFTSDYEQLDYSKPGEVLYRYC
jgi:lipopolysaccharide biosynthesis protein